MIVKIGINSSNWDQNSPKFTREMSSLPQRIVQGSDDIVYEELGLRIPVKTGFMKNSRTREIQGNKGIVRVTASYAGFVNDGTGPSPGRYVAAIGKRIRTGTHPGQKGQHFLEKSVQAAIPRIQAFLDDLAKELFS